MKCARLNLQERSKVKVKPEPSTSTEKPRRYCQKRLVNPEHEDDPKWMDIWDRFTCNLNDHIRESLGSVPAQQDTQDVVLTVQTLKFQGDVDQIKRPRTSFKFKNITDGNKHRMFVKQVIPENQYIDEDRSSQLTYYYFDDYFKYLYNSDRSRPTSGKSSIFLKAITHHIKENKSVKENKATQIEGPVINNGRKAEPKAKRVFKKCHKPQVKEEVKELHQAVDNTKISYQNAGKRKILTISRAQSPETVQVIRVDVVCNYPSSSILSESEETKKIEGPSVRATQKLENLNMNNHFASKYLLTNALKTLDERLCGGSKVTLLCKTFKLSDRLSKTYDSQDGKYRHHTKSFQDFTKNSIKMKSNHTSFKKRS